MSTGQLDESNPALNLLPPADFETASFAQPTKGALNYPPTSRVAQLTRDGTFIHERLVPSTAMFDMRDVVFLSDSLMHIFIIIAVLAEYSHPFQQSLAFRFPGDHPIGLFILHG